MLGFFILIPLPRSNYIEILTPASYQCYPPKYQKIEIIAGKHAILPIYIENGQSTNTCCILYTCHEVQRYFKTITIIEQGWVIMTKDGIYQERINLKNIVHFS